MSTRAVDATNSPPERFSLVGSTIADRYRIVAPISRGAMGEVYRAEQLQLGREVAVKVLYASGSPAERREFHERFILEASSLARLTHPNTVRVFDFGLYDNRPFLVMEYVEGPTLRSLVQDEPLDPARAVRIGHQIAGALREAHDRQMLHRDLKTSNILVTSGPDGDDRVKVIDFGLVRQMDNEDEGLTQAGLVLGTPMYIAPELIEGERGDHRADIYSLGVVMYRLLTGKPPFSKQGGPRHILRRILASEVPAFEDVHAPLADIPRCIEWTIRTCLSKEPDERFRDMKEVQRALSACLTALTEPDANDLSLRILDGAAVVPEWVGNASTSSLARPLATEEGLSQTSLSAMMNGAVPKLVDASQSLSIMTTKVAQRSIKPTIIACVAIALFFGGMYYQRQEVQAAQAAQAALAAEALADAEKRAAEERARADAAATTASEAEEARAAAEEEARVKAAAAEQAQADAEAAKAAAAKAAAAPPAPRWTPPPKRSTWRKPKATPRPAPTPAPAPKATPTPKRISNSDLKNPFDAP